MVTLAVLLGAHALGQLAINMDENTQRYRSARALGAGSMILLGDSLTYQEAAIWGNMQDISAATHGNPGRGYQAISLWTGASYSTTQWTHGAINTDTPPHWSLDGMWVSTSGVSFLSMTPWNSHVVLHYVITPGGGTFTVQSGAQSWLVDANGADTLGTLEFNLSSPSFQVTTSGNGVVTLLGVDNRNGNPGPVIHRAANGGWGLDEVLRRNWTWEPQMEALNPDLVVVCFGGQNDWAFSWNTATWRLYLEQVCDRVHAAVPAAGIVLVSNYASSSEPSIVQRWETLSGVQRDVAAERGYGFVDLYVAGGPYPYWVSEGLISADGLHFADGGGYRAATIIHCAIDTDGACLVSYPCDEIDYNRDGLFPDSTDIDDFLSVFSGGPCTTGMCRDVDFNNDGLVPDTLDIDVLLRVFSGGSCL